MKHNSRIVASVNASNWQCARRAQVSGPGWPRPQASNAHGLSAIESFGQASNTKFLVSDCRD